MSLTFFRSSTNLEPKNPTPSSTSDSFTLTKVPSCVSPCSSFFLDTAKAVSSGYHFLTLIFRAPLPRSTSNYVLGWGWLVICGHRSSLTSAFVGQLIIIIIFSMLRPYPRCNPWLDADSSEYILTSFQLDYCCFPLRVHVLERTFHFLVDVRYTKHGALDGRSLRR